MGNLINTSGTHYMVLACSALLCILFGILCYRLILVGKKLQKEKAGRAVYESLEDSFRNGYSSYERLELWLKSIGADYSVKGFGDPFRFLVINVFLFAGVFILCGILAGPASGLLIAALVLGTELLMLEAIDHRHNKEMLDDISFLYDATRIQLAGNIYVVQAVSNCLIYIKNKRLKQALAELCSNLTLGGDVRTATRDFGEKFRNSYLDTFCSVLVQIATETGEAGKLIEDMAKQLSVLKETSFTEKKKSAENKLQLCIIGIFIVFTVLIFYLCLASMTGSAGVLL